MYKGSYSENTRKQMIAILKENDNFSNLHDCIINFFEDFDDLPENEQETIYEQLLMALPDNVLGDMYSWGMSDTCVRDNVYSFIEDNKEEFSTLTGLV
jgi:Fe-S-cluster formation regulator IscX/YfhJ